MSRKSDFPGRKLEQGKVDYDVCIGCRMCVAICPFGAMGFDVLAKKVMKCDLCDGDPQCARFCDVHAVSYLDANEQSVKKKKAVADKFSSIAQKVAAAMTSE
jgi:anaerobic carbon-monoxide dehydrogenase iron sulfur subunit